MEITIENVEAALAQFYRTNSTLQAEAHQWLMAVQNSKNAWSFVWELLQPDRSCEAQFYASNTLHLKIVNDWSEVPGDQYEILKSKILETIVAYSSGPKIVLNRLCIALAAFLLRVTPDYWQNAVEDIHGIFSPENLPSISQERLIWILLELLSVIPEELSSVRLTNSRKHIVTNAIKQATPKVMLTFVNLLDYNNLEVRSLAAKGVSTWMSMNAMPLSDCLNIATKLVNVTIHSVTVDSYESCEHEIEAISRIMTNPLSQEYKKSIISGLEIILKLHPLIQKSENQDFITSVYNLYLMFGETHGVLLLSKLASQEPRAVEAVQTLLQYLLACLSANGSFPRDETHSHIVVSFWSTLFDVKNNLSSNERKIVSGLLEPLYKELCHILLQKSQYPPDDIILTASEAELLRIYRQDIADTIANCYVLIHQFLISLLETSLANAQSWQIVEAVLHVVYSLAETSWNSEGDNSGIPEPHSCLIACDPDNGIVIGGRVGEEERKAVVSLLVNIPPNLINSQVINSLNMAIGAYAEWWTNHPEILGQLIPTLINSLQDPETSTSATMALKDVTRECTSSIEPYAQVLLNSSMDILKSTRLREDECIRLMYSVGKLLSLLPYDEMYIKLNIILNHYKADIDAAISRGKTNESRVIILLRLRMLSNLCSSIYLTEKENVNVDPPVVIILRSLLPVLSAVTEHWSSNAVMIEEVCKCIKSSATKLIYQQSILFVPEITKVALSGYMAQPNPVMLELTRQLFLIFGKYPAHLPLLTGVVRSISDTTVSLAMNNKASSSSDVIQVYFQLMSAIGKRNIHFLETAIDLLHLFNFATAALMLPEGPTVKAAGQLICMLTTQNKNFQRPIIESVGENLVETILKTIGGDSPLRISLNAFAEIFVVLNKSYCTSFARWLNTILSKDNFPTEKASSMSKTNFIRMILRERTMTNRLMDCIEEFSLICRGIVHYQPVTPVVR